MLLFEAFKGNSNEFYSLVNYYHYFYNHNQCNTPFVWWSFFWMFSRTISMHYKFKPFICCLWVPFCIHKCLTSNTFSEAYLQHNELPLACGPSAWCYILAMCPSPRFCSTIVHGKAPLCDCAVLFVPANWICIYLHSILVLFVAHCHSIWVYFLRHKPYTVALCLKVGVHQFVGTVWLFWWHLSHYPTPLCCKRAAQLPPVAQS
jgi:hypothetical protein